MERRKFRDGDAPTTPEDWIGAAEVRPSQRPRKVDNPMMFYVYRSSADRDLFAVVANGDKKSLPPCPANGSWEFFKRFAESGRPRIGFSETAARHDIERQGFHINRIDIDMTVGSAK